MELILKGTMQELGVMMAHLGNGILTAKIAEDEAALAEQAALAAPVPEPATIPISLTPPVDAPPVPEPVDEPSAVAIAEPQRKSPAAPKATKPSKKKSGTKRKSKVPNFLLPGAPCRVTLDVIEQHPGITNQEVADATGFDLKKASNCTNRLATPGVIARDPNDRMRARWYTAAEVPALRDGKAVADAEPVTEQVATPPEATPTPAPVSTVVEEAPLSDRAMVVIRETPGLLSREVGERMGIPYNSVTALMTRMRRANLIRSEGEGGGSDPYRFYAAD